MHAWKISPASATATLERHASPAAAAPTSARSRATSAGSRQRGAPRRAAPHRAAVPFDVADARLARRRSSEIVPTLLRPLRRRDSVIFRRRRSTADELTSRPSRQSPSPPRVDGHARRAGRRRGDARRRRRARRRQLQPRSCSPMTERARPAARCHDCRAARSSPSARSTACTSAIATSCARRAERAAARGFPSLLVTFEPHPLEVVNPSAAPLLLTPDAEKLEARRRERSRLRGRAAVHARPRALSIRGSVRRDVLLERYLHARARDRSRSRLRPRPRRGRRSASRARRTPRLRCRRRRRRSRRRRRTRLIERDSHAPSPTGDLESARRSLGRRYAFSGRVVPGDQRGRDSAFRPSTSRSVAAQTSSAGRGIRGSSSTPSAAPSAE